MKVLQVSKLYYPWIGGVERVVQDIAEGIKDKVDVEVLACQARGFGGKEIINGVSVTKSSAIGMFFSMPLSLTFPFHLATKSRKSDILHFHIPFPLGELSHLIFGNKSKKVIVHYHSDVVKQRWALQFYRPLLKRFLKRADKIIVTSNNLLNSSEHLKPFLDKCVVVPISIDVQRFTGGDVAPPKSKKLLSSLDEKIILFVGRLNYYKGLEFLIEAMSGVQASLIIAGEGPLRNELEGMVKNLEIESKVFFVGRQSDSELRYWYNKCDVFVLPSVERTEAFGIVQLEAMAFKKPVINTNLPTGVVSVSVHGETGFTIPPRDPESLKDALKTLLNDDGLRLRFGENAYKRVKGKFSLDKTIDSIHALYMSI